MFSLFLSATLELYKLMNHLLGSWKAEIEIPKDASLEELEVRYVEGERKVQFMQFMRCMLQWRPEDRKTAKELLEHPWLNI
jgi:serine/threonine-protein kinase SRPK3